MMQTSSPEAPTPCIKVAPILNSCRWIEIEMDGSEDAEDIQGKIDKFMSEVGQEEYRVVDHEGFGFQVSEHPDLEDLILAAKAIEDHGTEGLVGAVINVMNGDIKRGLTAVTEDYRGCDESVEAWAQDDYEQSHDMSEIPDALRGHIDWVSYARDLECGSAIWTLRLDGLTHVFTESGN